MRWPVLAILVAALAGCDRLPGKPKAALAQLRPTDVTSFEGLYGNHCAACHGDNGRLGAARPLNDPLYLAIVPDEVLTRVTTEGVPGSLMPGFAISAGGELTDEQVGILVTGMRERWATPGAFEGQNLPAYAAGAAGTSAGAISRGRLVFENACSRCHGHGGRGGPKAGSVVDHAFLQLVTDQALRTAVIAGRIDLGMPDYRHVDERGPLGDRQIADVVAWMRSNNE